MARFASARISEDLKQKMELAKANRCIPSTEVLIVGLNENWIRDPSILPGAAPDLPSPRRAAAIESMIAEGPISAYSPAVRLPIVGEVAAGPAMLAEENIQDYISLPEGVARGAAFALWVEGDSMKPTIEQGDLALVRAQPEAKNNEIVVALFPGVDAAGGVVKRLRHEGLGCDELRSDNQDYEPIYSEFTIIGIVVALIRNF